MKGKRLLGICALLLALLLAACGGESMDGAGEAAAPAADGETVTGAGEAPATAGEAEVADAEEEEMAGAEHEDSAMDEMAGDESAGDEAMADAPADVPAWMIHSLTNAATGESFTLADFAGKTVFVEPMATWCTNCRRQLTDVKVAQANFDPEEVVIIGLSVETNLSDEDLALFATQADFNWTWAVATPELLRDLVATFGQSVTNAPATPHFIIRPDGSYTELDTGFESPDELTAQIEAARQG